jgi:hypothetical protein
VPQALPVWESTAIVNWNSLGFVRTDYDFEVSHGCDWPSPDMVKSLMDSGVFPLELRDGMVTLDRIAENMCVDENEYWGEILEEFLQEKASSS